MTEPESSSSASTDSKVYVLYVDHQGHPAPLSSCYHATGTRRLSSSVDRYPPSTITEVDSAYCPQCLTSHDADSAARMGACPKPSCQRCPVCVGALTVDTSTAGDAQTTRLCFYKCSVCAWDSRGCGLTQPTAPHDEVSRVEMSRALEALGDMLQARRQKAQSAAQQYTQIASQAWDTRTKGQRQKPPHRKSSLHDNGPEGWSVEALEAKLRETKQRHAAKDRDVATTLGMEPVQRVDLSVEPTMDPSLLDVPQVALELQSLNASVPTSRNDLWPLPTPFRPRLSRRCRAELHEGRPGILLKPKLNPLEGDSSLRSGHGQWWKKDSSAIHVMPRIKVLQHLTTNQCRVCLLQVTNPTLGPVRLRFGASAYPGEAIVEWDSVAAKDTTYTPILNELLVDELVPTHLTLELQTSMIASLQRTQAVELLSAEDSFIELGGKSREVPTEVQQWQPPDVSLDSNESVMRLVASSSSTAYFELVLAHNTLGESQHSVAVPLLLELEAGHGSWESSLIEPTSSEEPDWVPFDLVLAWT